MHPASAHEAALKTPSADDTLGAFPLGRVLVKTDILVLGKLKRIRDGDDDGGTVIKRHEILATAFAKGFIMTVL